LARAAAASPTSAGSSSGLNGSSAGEGAVFEGVDCDEVHLEACVDDEDATRTAVAGFIADIRGAGTIERLFKSSETPRSR